jgi:hypothetical protein
MRGSDFYDLASYIALGQNKLYPRMSARRLVPLFWGTWQIALSSYIVDFRQETG